MHENKKDFPIPSEEIDSTFQQVEWANDCPTFEGTHVWGQYSVSRQIKLFTEPMEVMTLTKYEVDGEEINRVESRWDVSECDEMSHLAEVEQYTVDHSGETVLQFAESNHFADPQADIEAVVKEHDPQ